MAKDCQEKRGKFHLVYFYFLKHYKLMRKKRFINLFH